MIIIDEQLEKLLQRASIANDFNALKGQQNSDISSIRDFSQSQVDLWRRVPYLALQADGRVDHSDAYAQAFYNGIWKLESTVIRGYFHAAIDCETGTIIQPTKAPLIASDEIIAKIALDELDARNVISTLIGESQRPTASYFDVAAKEVWRQEVIAEVSLTPIYTRIQKRAQLFPGIEHL